MFSAIIVMAKKCLHKQNHFLLFSLLKKHGKLDIYNDEIQRKTYYSKHGASAVEHFEMPYNHSYGKGITAQNQGHP